MTRILDIVQIWNSLLLQDLPVDYWLVLEESALGHTKVAPADVVAAKNAQKDRHVVDDIKYHPF